jgi:intracellular sulfur oxidation DsrE/DsrF family protein
LLRVVVHVNFADPARQAGGLKNVENILKTAAARQTRVEVEVVCHADGIVLLERAKTSAAGPVGALIEKGVKFAACENTMRQRSIKPEDLLPGVSTVPSGAFEVVSKQHDGYAYFKP